MKEQSTRIYNFHFWLVCLSALLFFASFNMLLPELPAYLTQLGGADYKGLIIWLFTLTALLSRPFSGKLADKIGRVPVMMCGSAVCIICSAIYPMLTSIYGFFLLRFVHGFSTGFTPTGQAAYLSDVIPAHKRGEAMGYLGTAGAIGSAAGPAIGGLVALKFGLNTMFYLSSLFALTSIIILINTQETLKEKNRFRPSMLKVTGSDLFEPRVLAPCVVMVLCAFAYGAVYTLMPDFGTFVGIENKGLLFTYLTVASLLVRLLAGKASDRFGRIPVLKFSSMLIIIAMIVIGLAKTQLILISGIVLYGFGQGTTSSTLLAWATDLSDENFRGRGLASLYIFMEMGIGLGAVFSAWLYANDSANFFFTFLVSSILAFIAFSYLTLKPLLARA